MIEEIKMDIEKIRNLLHIAESSVKWPSLKGLHDAAMAELVKHSLEQAKLAEDARKKAAEEAAAVKAKQERLREEQRERDEVKSAAVRTPQQPMPVRAPLPPRSEDGAPIARREINE